ncbi:hypothetical protein A0H81_05263 [Grifola frondosa]|uniref:Protein kinase domain-containing protein n=1 Tax=Grifola frondosa TaxID=5627 RepID=A0A1C7MD42_GRIFR|nr:hypothetical protein A0H81_05263 [Grifola frondosa]
MSTLRFPTRPSDETCVEFYKLKCVVPSNTDATETFEIRDAKLIHCASSTVYRGMLVDGGQSRDVICKLVTTKRRMKHIIAEARFYSNEFKKLQGVTVPHFHGRSVLNTLQSVHLAGVQRNDFSEQNIVVDRSYRPFIIDFEIANQHKCGQAIPVVVNAKEPTWKEFGSEEMRDSCLIADIWQPHTSSYLC